MIEPTMNNKIIFQQDTPDGTEEVIRLDKEGFHYRGQFIADAGEAHRLMVEFLRQQTQPEPQGPTDDEIEEWVDASWVVSLQEQCPDGDGWLISLTPEEFCNAIREALTRWGS